MDMVTREEIKIMRREAKARKRREKIYEENMRKLSGQKTLEPKLWKAMRYLEIPYDRRRHSCDLDIDQTGLWTRIRDSCSQDNLIQRKQLAHEIRVGLYSILLMDYLGVKDKKLRHQIFSSFLCHDVGKDMVIGPQGGFPILPADLLDFGDEEREKMTWHVNPDVFLLKD